MQKQKGFTIIELIVVIAIIAVLASIVLVGVQSYIKKSKDTTLAADMNQLQKAATMLFGTDGSYTGIVPSSTFININIAIGNGLGPHNIQGMINNNAYCLIVELNDTANPTTGKWWCIDSTGSSLKVGTSNRACGYGNTTGMTCR